MASKETKEVDFEEVAGNATMRDWLIISQKLDGTQEEILGDGVKSIVAVAWLYDKQRNGTGSDMNKFLDMSQNDILEFLGVDVSEETSGDE